MFHRARALTLAVPLLCMGIVGPALAARKPKAPPPATVTPPPAPDRVTSVEGITEYRLANGLRVLLFPDQSKQTITVNLTYLVGSRHENYGETGMAHLLEHLVFKGSPRHPDIPAELTAHGARPNGTTSWDRTNYFETFAASEENLRWALDLEADRMVNSFIRKEDLDSEMTVVRNEYEMGENNPTAVLFKRVLSVAYDWHNYGKVPIGARSDIENVGIENLRAFYRTYYQPDNAILVVAGKIDEAATLSLVNEYFGAIAKPTRVLPTLYTAEPVQDGERRVTLRREGDVQVMLAGYHAPPGSHADFAPLQILAQILTDAPTGRLHKALVEPGKAAAVFPAGLMLQEPGLFGVGAQVRDGVSVEDVLGQTLDIVEKPAAQPVTDEEVERARGRILKQFELSLNNSEQVGLALSDWMGMGDWRLLFVHRDRVRAVTTADVQRVWAQYYKPANRTVGVFIPTKSPDRAEVPPPPDVLALVKDYQGDAARDDGETFDPSPANIEARLRRFTLPNGMQVALLPKKTRGGGVRLAMSLRFGDETSLRNLGAAPTMTTAMLLRGTRKHTRQQIEDELDRLKARINSNSWGSGQHVSVETTKENLAAVVTLLHEILTEPAFDPKELEQLRAEILAGMEQQRTDPNSLAFLAFARRMQPYPRGDIRYVESIDESIADLEALKREQLVAFHRDYFGAQAGQLAIVGDFDADEIRQQITRLFGEWRGAKPYTRIDTRYFAVGPGEEVIQTPDKAQAMFIAGMNLKLRDDHPDYPALVLGNYMLGGSGMNSRLMARIRGKEGLSYGTGSQFSADTFVEAGSFMAFAIHAPENGDKLRQVFDDELKRVFEEGFSPEEVEAAKSGYLQSRAVSRAQDNELAGNLTHRDFTGRTLAWDADLDAKIAALDAETIRVAMRRHLDPAKLTVVKAGDFAGKAAK